MALDGRNPDTIRPAPMADLVKCDICSIWIVGRDYFSDDHLVCRECFLALDANKERILAENLAPSVRFLLLSLVVSSGFSWIGVDYPIVEMVTGVIQYGSLAGLIVQSARYLFGRRSA